MNIRCIQVGLICRERPGNGCVLFAGEEYTGFPHPFEGVSGNRRKMIAEWRIICHYSY